MANGLGNVTSSNAILTVVTPPAITNQPASQRVAETVNVSFTVGAVGSAPLTYQWQLNGAPLVNGGVFNGVTTPTLTLANVRPIHSGTYSVVVSNPGGNLTSSGAILTVIPAMTLADAVNAPYLAWNTGASAPWVSETNLTHDGVGAVRSGTITNSQNTWLE